MDKTTLRHLMREKKNNLSFQDKLLAEQKVLDILKCDEHIQKCPNLVAYWSLPDELPTRQIISYFAKSKQIFLPVMVGSTLEFRQFQSEEKLTSDNKFGISEPILGDLLDITQPNIVALIPGVAFTNDGARLGRGGGYYDRILSQLKLAYKIGIAFECQIVSSIPIEPHDIKMNKIVYS